MRIPLVHSVSLRASSLRIIFETGEKREFESSTLLSKLNAISQQRFTSKDIKSIEVVEGIVTFKSKPISFKKKNGEKIESFYDLDPNFVFSESISSEFAIGDLFKSLREKSRMSTDDVAERCKSDRAFINRFENNKIQPEWNTIRRLFFLAFGKTVDVNEMFVDVVA